MGAALWSWFLVGSDGNVRHWSVLAGRRFRLSVPFFRAMVFVVSESAATGSSIRYGPRTFPLRCLAKATGAIFMLLLNAAIRFCCFNRGVACGTSMQIGSAHHTSCNSKLSTAVSPRVDFPVDHGWLHFSIACRTTIRPPTDVCCYGVFRVSFFLAGGVCVVPFSLQLCLLFSGLFSGLFLFLLLLLLWLLVGYWQRLRWSIFSTRLLVRALLSCNRFLRATESLTNRLQSGRCWRGTGAFVSVRCDSFPCLAENLSLAKLFTQRFQTYCPGCCGAFAYGRLRCDRMACVADLCAIPAGRSLLDEYRKRPCSGHCLFGRLVTVSSWSWL